MSKSRILILNRWDDEFAEYHRYIDHRRHRVAYITTRDGLGRLSQSEAAAVEVVESFEDTSSLIQIARLLSQRLDGIDRIIALSEFDLLRAAALREAIGVTGDAVAQVTRFRDKTRMKEAVAGRGLRVPAFTDCADSPALAHLVGTVGFPLILKPKCGAASQGVERVHSHAELIETLARIAPGDYECEEFVAGPIYHVDGLMEHGECRFSKVSRYINTCLGYKAGEPLGSVLLDEVEYKTSKIRDFALRCLGALQLDCGAFHLELIEGDEGELCFLEVGARVGGGEIPFLMRDLFGIDLIGAWLAMHVGEMAKALNVGTTSDAAGGFLMIPEPAKVPCRVRSVTSLQGRIPYLYHEIIPQPGDVLDGNGGYSKISGRFLFRSPSAAATEAAIRQAIAFFRLDVEPTPRRIAAAASPLAGDTDAVAVR